VSFSEEKYPDQSTCGFCGKIVYYGYKYKKNGSIMHHRDWRHVDTGNMKCVGVVPHAMPEDEVWQRVRAREVAKDLVTSPHIFTRVRWEPKTLDAIIFNLIKVVPGISGGDIRRKFGEVITDTEIVNSLTRIRRSGSIENRGGKKFSRWYLRGEV
jgi:hypothetical protein